MVEGSRFVSPLAPLGPLILTLKACASCKSLEIRSGRVCVLCSTLTPTCWVKPKCSPNPYNCSDFLEKINEVGGRFTGIRTDAAEMGASDPPGRSQLRWSCRESVSVVRALSRGCLGPALAGRALPVLTLLDDCCSGSVESEEVASTRQVHEHCGASPWRTAHPGPASRTAEGALWGWRVQPGCLSSPQPVLCLSEPTGNHFSI